MTSLTEAATPIRLLLVEDHPGDVRLFREYLSAIQTHHFTLSVVGRMEEAFLFLADNQIDLIVLDLTLPDSWGLETLNRLFSRVSTIPVIVLSGLNDESIAIEAVSIGAQDYLVKSQITKTILSKSILYAIQRAQAQDALRESRERYTLAAQAVNDGLWDWDLRADTVFYSSRWCSMIGMEKEEITSSPASWYQRVHPDDLPNLQGAIQAHLNGASRHIEIEYRMRHRNGSYRWMLCRGAALFDPNDIAYRLAGSQTDITARKHTEQRLIHEALHDPLTNLPNRVLFGRRLQDVLKDFRSENSSRFAVFFIDLDRFKTINDSLGHVTGDQLLCAIARRLENCLPPDAMIARLGGDEFAILLNGISVPADALRVAKRIIKAMEYPFRVQQHKIFTTACIGIALSSDHYQAPDEILRDADTAMYRAKAVGPGQYQVFDTAMHTRAVALWQLETDLRRAIEQQEFSIHYQPIVSFANGRLAGFEALVRWNHPVRGLLYPGDFLAVADETGLLATIDRWMIFNGALQLKKWQEQFPSNASIFLSLNLSDGLINQYDLPAFLSDVLSETRLDPRTLKLEITETIVTNDLSSLTNTLAKLREMNIQLCLDDFGTGYSSLSSLHAYPVDVLKVDSSFVNAMSHESGGLEIVRTIITLAHDLNLQVIAEGVETPQQYAQLQALGCEFGQGLLFSQAADMVETGVLTCVPN